MAVNKPSQQISSSDSKDKAVRVEIRLMFLQIGSISTQLEQFDAHVAIEARWLADDSVLSTIDDDARNNLAQGEIVHLPEDFSEKKENWLPKLFLLNSTVKKEDKQIRYSLKKDDEDHDKSSTQIYVREHQNVNGTFQSSFDLHHYPNDVQELSVSIGSALRKEKVKLVQHPTVASGINREIFEAEKEWHLYEHVETRSRTIRGYSSQADEDHDLDKPGKLKERSVLTFSYHVARKSTYFFWNGYCIVFLLTAISFSSFAITADQTQQRLSVAYTLLLSQVAFRWTLSVSHMVPPISYLTTMDKYSVASMIVLVILAAWHSIIGSVIFTLHYNQAIEPNTYWLWVDRILFFVLIFLYIVLHLIFFISHFCGPYRYRRKMMRKDKKYRMDNYGSENEIDNQTNNV